MSPADSIQSAGIYLFFAHRGNGLRPRSGSRKRSGWLRKPWTSKGFVVRSPSAEIISGESKFWGAVIRQPSAPTILGLIIPPAEDVLEIGPLEEWKTDDRTPPPMTEYQRRHVDHQLRRRSKTPHFLQQTGDLEDSESDGARLPFRSKGRSLTIFIHDQTRPPYHPYTRSPSYFRAGPK